MFCKNCGNEVDDNTVVCPECGADIETVNDEEFDSKQPTARSERQAKLDEIKERREQKRKKEQQRRIMAVVILVAIIIAAAGGVLAWLNISFGDRVEVEEPKTTGAPVYSQTAEPIEEDETPATPEMSPEVVETPTPVPINTATPSVNENGEPLVTAVPRVTETPTTAPKAAATTKASATPKTSSAVKMGSKIENKYVRLENVYVSKTTGMYIMSFKMGNTEYYANVNKGTTTSQIKNKYYYITAHATDAVYNGKPVYEITAMTTSKQTAASTPKSTEKPQTSAASVSYSYSGDYVLANSSTAYVTDAQLSNLSTSELNIAKNEIYARHGRKFKSDALQKYFESKSWYKVNANYNYANDSANLTQIEKTNLLKILKYQK